MATSVNFFEQVNKIKNSKMSNAAKRRALIEVGLTPSDVNLIITTYQIENREAIAQARAERMLRAQLRAPQYTFGVEIECFVSRDKVRENACENGLNYQYEGYNHRDNEEYFKFVTDGSLCGYADPIECVSPVLKSRGGFDTLKAACDTLNASDAKVNRTCGLHVHIGASELTEEQYSNVFINYAYLERVINTFMPASRQNNYYAQSLVAHIGALKNTKTISGVRSALDHDRYHKVNCESYSRHRTVEFRQHQGTTNFAKIENWVKFCGKLVAWSKTNRLTDHVASIDDIKFLTATEKKFFKKRAEKLNALSEAV